MPPPRNADYGLVAARMGPVVEAFKQTALQDAAILEATRGSAQFLDADEAEDFYRAGLKNPQLWADRGFTRESLLVAIHALKCKSEAPLYIQQVQERHVARMKTLPTEGGGGDGKGRGFVIPVAATAPEDEPLPDDEEQP